MSKSDVFLLSCLTLSCLLCYVPPIYCLLAEACLQHSHPHLEPARRFPCRGKEMSLRCTSWEPEAATFLEQCLLCTQQSLVVLSVQTANHLRAAQIQLSPAVSQLLRWKYTIFICGQNMKQWVQQNCGCQPASTCRKLGLSSCQWGTHSLWWKCIS